MLPSQGMKPSLGYSAEAVMKGKGASWVFGVLGYCRKDPFTRRSEGHHLRQAKLMTLTNFFS